MCSYLSSYLSIDRSIDLSISVHFCRTTNISISIHFVWVREREREREREYPVRIEHARLVCPTSLVIIYRRRPIIASAVVTGYFTFSLFFSFLFFSFFFFFFFCYSFLWPEENECIVLRLLRKRTSLENIKTNKNKNEWQFTKTWSLDSSYSKITKAFIDRRSFKKRNR